MSTPQVTTVSNLMSPFPGAAAGIRRSGKARRGGFTEIVEATLYVYGDSRKPCMSRVSRGFPGIYYRQRL